MVQQAQLINALTSNAIWSSLENPEVRDPFHSLKLIFTMFAYFQIEWQMVVQYWSYNASRCHLGAVQCSAVQCSAVQCITTLYWTILCCAVLYYTVLYCTCMLGIKQCRTEQALSDCQTQQRNAWHTYTDMHLLCWTSSRTLSGDQFHPAQS